MAIETAGEPAFGDTVRQMNKLMDQLQKGYFNYCPAETWTPSVNLYENDHFYVVCVDLAWVNKDEIDLQVIDGQLRLKGTRAVPTHPDVSQANSSTMRWRVHLMEIDNGQFSRTVDLPADVDRGQITATYREGVLWIEIPKVGQGIGKIGDEHR